MNRTLLLGLWRYMLPVPPKLWKGMIEKNAEKAEHSLGFMSEEHHLVRDFAVREMPRIGQPIPPEQFAEELGLPLEQVVDILDELEKRMTFLYRNEKGAVFWAYPVTVDQTPHRVLFDNGEQVNAA